MYTKLQ